MGMSDYIISLQDKAFEEFVAGRLDEEDLRAELRRTGIKDRDQLDGWIETAKDAKERGQ